MDFPACFWVADPTRSATECVSKYSAASLSERNLGRGVIAAGSFFSIRSTYFRRNKRRSLSSISRAVITRIRPLGKRRKTNFSKVLEEFCRGHEAHELPQSSSSVNGNQS